MRARIALPAVVMALVGAGGPARTQESVPGVRAEVVRLDAVVTDADGNPVRGLSREDFELLEDGKAQKLTHFLFVGQDADETKALLEAAGAPAEEGGPTGESRALGAGRYIVVLVDDLHIAPVRMPGVRDALKRMLDEFLIPDDRVAVVAAGAPSATQKLTQDRLEVKRQIDALVPRQAVVEPSRGSAMTPEQAELILRGDRNALLLAARNMKDEPGSIYSGASGQFGGPRGALASRPGGDPSAVGETPEEKGASVEAQQQARGILGEALRFSTVSLGRVDDVLRGLAPLPGRKLCLLVSEGFLVGAGTSEERTQDMHRVVDAATRSGAVVYALDARGLAGEVGVGDASVSGARPQQDLQSSVSRQSEQLRRITLETVSNDTGGFLVRGTNDLSAGLRRMIDDNGSYYLMAYEPTNQKRDGRFRRIELRLAGRRQLVVRTRKGYYAADARQPAGPSAPEVNVAEGLAALGKALPSGGLPVRLTADFLALPPSGPQALVRANVDVGGLAWQKSKTGHHATLHIAVGAYDAEGNPVGVPFGGRRELDLNPAEYERVRTAGVDFQRPLPLDPGRYEIRILARDLDGKAVGGAKQWVEIPNLEDKNLALSSVFVSSSSTALSNPLAEPAAGAPPGQMLRRFKPTDSLYFRFYVYNAFEQIDGSADALIQAQILSQSKVIAASKPQPASMLTKDGVAVAQANGMSLDGMAPGAYELRVVVVDRIANLTASRNVDFTVE
jgi:VWFA-related protein